MYANNEIGTIQPIRQISKTIRDFNSKLETHENSQVIFHVDACQAVGFLNMNVQHLGADLVTFNGSKIYGPRGVGVLYVRRGTKLRSLILGGSQERGLRAGTENVPAIVGLAKAVALLKEARIKKQELRIKFIRDYAIKKLEEISGVILNGREKIKDWSTTSVFVFRILKARICFWARQVRYFGWQWFGLRFSFR